MKDTRTQNCILYDSVYIMFWKRQRKEIDIKTVIARTEYEMD